MAKKRTPTMAKPRATTDGSCEAREISHAEVASRAMPEPTVPTPSRVAATTRPRAGRAISRVRRRGAS